MRQFLIVFFALCAGLFAVPSGSLAASVDRTCQSGKALVAAGEPVEATKLFVSVLKRSPGNRCAQEALKSVTAKRDAKKPTTNPAAASAACARGSALNKADKGEKALAEFLVAAAKDPANDCWSKGIDSLRPDVQQEVETVASSYRPLLTLAVELLVGGALLAYLLLALLARIPGIRRAYVIRTVRYPRLDVADPDAEALGDDKPWSSMVAVRLRGRVGARRPLGKDLYTLGARSTVATTLGGLNDVSGYAKTLVTLIALAEKLLPRRSYTVETVLEPAGGSSGLSITVAFRDDQGVRGTETFEAGEYYAVPSSASGPAADVGSIQGLVVPAAAWVEHGMLSELAQDSLPTRDAASYALLHTGLECQAQGRADDAKALYRKARQRDGRNIAATVNLALLVGREVDGFKQAEAFLVEALMQMERRAGA